MLLYLDNNIFPDMIGHVMQYLIFHSNNVIIS